MPHKYITPGQPLHAAISARTYNGLVDILNRAETEGGSSPPEISRSSVSTLGFRNDHTVAVKEREIVVLGAPVFLPGANLAAFKQNVVLKGTAPVSTSRGKFGVVLGATPVGKLGRVATSGTIAVQVNVVDALHTHADVTPSVINSLTSGFAGTAEILWKESGTGLNWAVIRFPVIDYGVILGVTKAQIAVGGSGAIDVYRNGSVSAADETVHLTWMHGNQVISVGKQVRAEWISDQRKWIITGAECET